MKKYILFFAVLLAAMTVKAYDINYAGCYRSFKLEFQSVDENNQPVTLSELVTIPLEKDGVTNREVGFFVVSYIPFNRKQSSAATADEPFDALILRSIATEGAMTVELDDQGFGSSAGKTVPFLTNKLTARQSIDGLFAAMQYAKDNGIPVSDNYYTINAGFSLAGGRAIAVQRYLEKYSSAEEKAQFRLKQTICGGAPISATETFRYITSRAETDSTMVMYLMYSSGFYEANKQGSLHAFDRSEMIGEDGNLRPEALSTSTPLGRAFWKALSKEDMQIDWTPETPIKYIHLANDSIVTYKNAQLAIDAWGEKLQFIDRDMPGMKWNLSMLHPVVDAFNGSEGIKNLVPSFKSMSDHNLGAINFYAGMIDGCLRDTLITGMYGRTMNYKDMLTAIFDISSGLSKEIPLNLGVKLQNSTLTFKTLGNLHFTGQIVDSTGTVTTDIDVTLRPELKDSLSTKITSVDAQGYLHIPAEFSVTLPKILGLTFQGTCVDLYQFFENLTALVLHHKCPTEADAQKYCNAINANLYLTAKPIAPQIIAYYEYDKNESAYIIKPYAYSVSNTGYETRSDLFSVIRSLYLMNVIKTDYTSYFTIDNQQIKAFGMTFDCHVTDDLYGECKFYADILDSDSVNIGRMDFDVKGVDMNEDGTRQTMSIGFVLNVNELPIRIEGTCSNLNDALLAAALCYANLSCKTEAEAQAYADAVNQNFTAEMYVAQVNDDGTYSDNPSYTDYGPVRAMVTQDDLGAYYVQVGLNWMGKGFLPFTAVIKDIIY